MRNIVNEASGCEDMECSPEANTVLEQVGIAERDFLHARDNAQDADILRNSVRIKYIQGYTALRDGTQELGDEWIARHVKPIQERAKSLSEFNTIFGAAVGLIGLFPPASIPAGIVGSLGGAFFDLQVAAMEAEASAMEDACRAALSDAMSGVLANVEEMAAADFAAIASSEYQRIDQSFTTVGTMKSAFKAELRPTLFSLGG